MQFPAFKGTNISSPDSYRAGIYIVNPHQKVDERRFSASRSSDNAQRLTPRQRKRDVFEVIALSSVGKRYVFEYDIPVFFFNRIIRFG